MIRGTRRSGWRKQRLGVGVLVAAVVMGLSGCAAEPADEVVSTAPVDTAEAPTPTPIFASDEEALAAGVAAMQAAADVEVELTGRPGDPSARFSDVATGRYLDKMIRGHEQDVADGITYDGRLTIERPILQVYESNDTTATVTLYVCMDSSEAQQNRADGQSLEWRTEDRKVELQATVVAENGVTKVEWSELWPHDSCS